MPKKLPHPYLPELQVTEIEGERMVFEVCSESEPWNRHRVDLLANNGLSECDCADWYARQRPVVLTGTLACCKHVVAARHYFLNHLLPALAAQVEGEDNTP